MKKFVLGLLSLVISISLFAQAPAQTKPEILIVGTYHMSNPGRDIFNMQADDVLLPKRQQEIAQLMVVLKKFHPTKIAVESEVGTERVPKQYADYVAGKYTLSRNEIDQIGYRLAKELGHKTVSPVDIEGDFPMGRVINWAKANGKEQEFEGRMSKLGDWVKQQDAFLKSHTVLETFEFMNSDERVAQDVGFYFADVPYGDTDDYAGPDLLAKWYQRNIRIYNNITKLIDSPNDRILVIYGAGHLGWLRQDVANDPWVKLRKLSEFVEK